MNVWVGLGGATHNACVTLCTGDEILGICEQERITRVRGAGFNRTGLPDEALDELLRRSGRQRGDVTAYALAEPVPALTAIDPVRLDHHFAHACSAFLTSPFDSATIVVCDSEPPQMSVWDGDGSAINQIEWPWHDQGFAEIYSQSAAALGFTIGGHEQQMESLARLDPTARDDRATRLFSLDRDRLRLAPSWRAGIETWGGTGEWRDRASVAAAVQSRIGDLLIDFLGEVRCRAPARRRLCACGGLFYNSHFNSRMRLCGAFDEVFVPVNPGNAGLAVGAALHASGNIRRHPVTPFLGPSYSPEEIKATLDNCKLKYDWASETDTIAIAVEALQNGRFVAWFDGSMEWGPRALGARSIFASPFCPYVLDNLNRFLKHRDAWRGYSLSGIDTAIREHFDGPASAPFMDCDYVPKDPERFRHVLPGPNATVRVQTVGSDAPPRFRELLRTFGEVMGIPVLVNTSFNGFREPIVCNPRDAVRVFFGTGIDLLVLGQFVISK